MPGTEPPYPANLIVRDALVRGTRSPGDLEIVDGRFVPVGTADPAKTETIDAGGRLCIPGFVEPHIHLDKVLLAGSAPENRSGSLDEAIEILAQRKRTYSTDEIAERAGRIVLAGIANGVTRMRTHADIDSGCGLVAFDAMLALRERFAGLVDLQIVAFPQNGILGDRGTESLLREAMARGADVVGGMPFNETGPAASREHIRIAFDIARDHDADIDMHVDETDDPDARTLEMLCEATAANGWHGRVTAGHTCALAGYPDEYAARVIDAVAEAGVNVIVNPATNLMLQGRGDPHPKRRGITRVKELLAKGANVAFGQDNLRDMFYPFGRADPLELALLLAHAAHMSQPDEIDTLFSMATERAARVLRATDYGTEPGCAGDLVILDARSPVEAIARRADRLHVIRRGRVVSRTVTTQTVPAP